MECYIILGLILLNFLKIKSRVLSKNTAIDN